jgi:PAS domain S-box-containing protein
MFNDTAIASITAILLMIFTYKDLYAHYHHTYFKKWLIAWIIHGIKCLFFESQTIDHSSCLLLFMYFFLSIIVSLLVLSGIMEFQSKHLPPCRSILGSFLLFTAGYCLVSPPQFLYTLFCSLLTGTINTLIVLTLRSFDISGAGKRLILSAGIFPALYAFSMPLFCHINRFIPWAYRFDSLFLLIVSTGMILMHFEKNKHQVERYYHILSENSVDVIYRYRFDSSTFEYISPAISQWTGYSPKYFNSVKRVLRMIHPEDRNLFTAHLHNCQEHSGCITIRVRHKNGETIWAEQKYSIKYDAAGNFLSIEGCLHDATKRIQLEQDVSRLDRLNMLGQMSANLAHEIRNPLTTIRGYLQLFGQKAELGKYKEQISLLLGELDRTNQILTEYLALSKNKLLEMKKSNLNAIIDALFPLIQADAVTMKTEVYISLGKVPEIYLDEKEIKQLVLNLTRNAIEAMPSGGKLEIKTASVENETILAVSDQGSGISSDILKNLGKPFLTTKENGTGLGMAICYRIAQHHNAKLDIDTGPNGTTIRARFRTG